MKVAYNNSLRRFMILSWRNNASEMFANLGIPSFDELLRKFVFGFRSRIIVSTNMFKYKELGTDNYNRCSLDMEATEGSSYRRLRGETFCICFWFWLVFSRA